MTRSLSTVVFCAAIGSIGALSLIACSSGSSSTTPSGTDGTRPATAPAGAVVLSAQDFKFVPSTITGKVGTPITLFVTNDSTGEDHDLKSELPIEKLSYAHADNADNEKADNQKNNTLDVDFKMGSWAQVTFTPTKEGTFEFHCDEPGHKDKGMKGSFVISK